MLNNHVFREMKANVYIQYILLWGLVVHRGSALAKASSLNAIIFMRSVTISMLHCIICTLSVAVAAFACNKTPVGKYKHSRMELAEKACDHFLQGALKKM